MTLRPAFVCLCLIAAAILSPSCGGSKDSGPTAPPMPTPPTAGDPVRQVIAALFFASGPQASADGGCGGRRFFATFPQGARVRIVLGSGVSAASRSGVRNAMMTLESAMSGYLRIEVVDSAQPEPRPGSHEIVVVEASSTRFPQLCPANVSRTGGCVVEVNFGPLRDRVLVAQAAGSGVLTGVHEIGHGFGFCHLGPSGHVMSATGIGSSDWSADEVDAIRRVFTSGLQPGATAAEARALGLID